MRLRILFILIIFTGAGCAHLRQTPAPAALPPGAPEVAVILDSLNAAGRSLENLESNGTIRMRLPGEAGTQRFETGHIRFQQPAQFFAQGRKLNVVVRVYSTGGAFLLELPSENTFYYGVEGDQFDDIALDVAPSRIFRELFLIDILADIDPDRVVMESFDAVGQRATLAVYREGRRRSVERRLVVASLSEGWCVVESDLFDADGELAGETTREDHAILGGVPLPTRVTAIFPRHEAEMSFTMRTATAKVNLEQPRAMDDIEAKRNELLAKGFREVRGISKKEGVQ